MLHGAQGLPYFVTENAYKKEEESFKAYVENVHVSDVPANANDISSHVLYKIKTLDDNSLLCKARISPHCNKNKEKHLLKTDSQTCPLIGIRILLSICVLFHWGLTKIDMKPAFFANWFCSEGFVCCSAS